MVTRFFLGANSGAGFFSLYDDFCRGPKDFLWVIKGGPGGGKSGFMKRIGSLAQRSGLDTEYIHCSGDPDSLDAVYVPALRTGWVDGTAPHVQEPAVFGATGAYIDLGAFCDTGSALRLRGELSELTGRYKEYYQRAYSCLAAADAASPERLPGVVSETEAAAAAHRAARTAARELPRASGRHGKITRRLLSGVTCRGEILLEDTLSTLCRRVYMLDNRYGLGYVYLDRMAAEATERGVDAIHCHDALCPAKLKALLLPGLSLGFVACQRPEELSVTADRHVRLDAMVDVGRLRPLRPRFRYDARIKEALISAAVDRLGDAKAIHDQLEALYNPYVDFDGIYMLAEEHFLRAVERR